MLCSKANSSHEKRKREEYEVQCFGLTAEEFSKEIADMYMESLISGLGGLHEYMSDQKSKQKKSPLTEEEIRQLDGIKNSYINEFALKIQNSLESIKDYTQKKIFNVPEHIVLPEDKVQERDLSSDAALNQQVSEMLSRLEALRYMETSMTQEIAEAEKILPNTQSSITRAENAMKAMPSSTQGQIEHLLGSSRSMHVKARSILPMQMQETYVEDWGVSSQDAEANEV